MGHVATASAVHCASASSTLCAALQALLKLCRFRNYHPAFKGRVFVDDSTPTHSLVRFCNQRGTSTVSLCALMAPSSFVRQRSARVSTSSKAQLPYPCQHVMGRYSHSMQGSCDVSWSVLCCAPLLKLLSLTVAAAAAVNLSRSGCCIQRVCWYRGTQHLTVLRADFKSHAFSISHTPYRTPKAEDEEAQEADVQRCGQLYH
jgi:hypothetical protein